MQYYQVSGTVLGMEKSKIIRFGSNYSQAKVERQKHKQLIKHTGNAVR